MKDKDKLMLEFKNFRIFKRHHINYNSFLILQNGDILGQEFKFINALNRLKIYAENDYMQEKESRTKEEAHDVINRQITVLAKEYF